MKNSNLTIPHLSNNNTYYILLYFKFKKLLIKLKSYYFKIFIVK